MRTLLLLPLLGLAFFSASCRVNTPLDPMTMKPSCKCLPGHFKKDGSCCSMTVEATK